jgi:sulfur carrier protein
MVIKINGEPETLAQQRVTVAELLSLKKVEMPEMVSVQLNGEFVERQAYASAEVKDRDEVDFLYFMGGGAR